MHRLTDGSTLNNADFVLFGMIAASLFFAVIYQLTGMHLEFSNGFTQEDGPIEWGTAVFLFLAALVLFRNFASLLSSTGVVAAVVTLFYGILFVFGAGEEISWGQRVFNWESSEFFAENNFQRETNLHNLVVGEKQLTKTLFGPILTFVLLMYLAVLPLLYSRMGWVRAMSRVLRIPVPGLRHAGWAVAASVLIAVLDMDRKWEVYEFVFSLLAVSIFLAPQNRDEVT
jgi:hypothetical protein